MALVPDARDQAQARRPAMRVLFVAQLCPWPPTSGGRQRLYHLLEALCREHRVTLLTPSPEEGGEAPPWLDRCEQVIQITPVGRDLTGYWSRFFLWGSVRHRLGALVFSALPARLLEQGSDGLARELDLLQRSGASFDVVWAARTPTAEAVRRAGFGPIVVDVDDVEALSLRRRLAHARWSWTKPLQYAELARLWVYERSVPRRFWRAVVCKDEDRAFFPRGGRDVFVVPNGVPLLTATPPDEECPDELLFVGTLHWEPNVDAVQTFHAKILPLIRQSHPGARFRMVGRRPAHAVLGLHDGAGCTLHADVPEVRPFYARASVVVAPIALGSGTKLKVLEALAFGKALVATKVAVEGLGLRPGVDFLLADEPAAFAAACCLLLENPAERHRLGAEGRRRVLERFTWDAVGADACAVLNGVRPVQ